MRTALFAIIIADIVCDFDASMFNSKTYKNIFGLSTAILTYVELKDVSSLKEPSYIKQSINKENTIFSPINMYTITSLLLNGAKEGSTKNELMYFLNITDNIEKYINEFLDILTYLNDIENIELHLGTAVYVQDSVELTFDFSSICLNKFNCSISNVDFRNNVLVAKIINSWVQKTTNYKILHDEISPVNIDKGTKIMLVNIIYHNSRWLNLTYKREIKEHKFYVSPSKMFFVPTIKFEKSTFIHGEIPHWNAKFIEIPFLDNNVTMTIFLPNGEMEPGNLEYLGKKINFAEFQLIRTAYTNKFEQDMELYLPKFTVEYHHNMTDFFRQSHVITIFGDNADFTHISKVPLKVNNIVQSISVNIKEESLEAPNVVRGRVKKPIRKPGPLQELIVDRPFHYIIEVHREMIFVGTVRVPDFRFIRDEF